MKFPKVFFWPVVAGTLVGASWGWAADPAELWQTAVKAYQHREYTQGQSVLRQYLALERNNGREDLGRYFLAELERLAGQSQAALDSYQRLFSSRDEGIRFSSRMRAGEWHFEHGQYGQAAEFFRALDQEPGAQFLIPDPQLAQLKSELKLGRVSEAQKIFKRVLETYPRALLYPEIHFLFGFMKALEGKPLDALKIIAEVPEHPLASLVSGLLLESQGRFLPAIEAYNAVLSQGAAVLESHRHFALYAKARAFYKSGDFLSARQVCRIYKGTFAGEPALEVKAELLESLIALSQARFSEVLERDGRYFSSPRRLSQEDWALARWAAGEAYLNVNQPEAALHNYLEAQKFASPYRLEILKKIGYLFIQDGKWPEAEHWLDECRRLAAPDSLTLVFLVRVALETGQPVQSFQSLRALVDQKDPLASLALYYWVVYQADHENFSALVEQWPLLEKTLADREPAPEYRELEAWTRLLVADAFYRQGQAGAAKQYYLRVPKFTSHGPLISQAQAGLAWCAFQNQEFSEAIEQSRLALAQPDLADRLKPELELLQAQAYFNQQAYADAIQGYREWIGKNPKNAKIPAVRFQVGWAQYLKQEYLDAVETWTSLAGDFPKSPEAHEALLRAADLYFQSNENQQARAIYQQLIREAPAEADVRKYRLRVAQTYYNEQNDGDAIRGFSGLIAQFPETEEGQEAQRAVEAASYRIADRVNDLSAFQEFIARFPHSRLAEDIQYRMGEALYQKGKFPESLENFSKFILTYTQSPRTPNAHYYLMVCQESLGNSPEAMQQAEAFIKNYPQHELAPELMFRLASLQFQSGQFAPAAEHFAQCADGFALKTYQAKGWFNAAIAYEKLELPQPAIQFYEKVTQTYPQDPNAALSFSRIALLRARQNQFVESEAALEKLKQLPQPELLGKTRQGLAALYRAQGENGRYETILNEMMLENNSAKPEYSYVLIDLAALYEQKKDWGRALAVYRRLAKTTDQQKWKIAAQKRIQLLQKIIHTKLGNGK